MTTASYYGRNIVKQPVWKSEIPLYFWTGGIAGASAVLHGLARLRGNEALAKRALFVGAVADVASPLLLVKDLGRPERFLNMFRMFKVTSPMSVGSWILLASGGASSTAAALELLGILAPVRRAAEIVSFAAGPPLATYTGALVANTSIPVWSEARDQLPWLFGASATATAGAAAAVVTPVQFAGPARRAAVAGAVAEGLVMREMRRRLGFVGEVYDQGAAGRHARIARACTTLGAGLLALAGRRPAPAKTGGLLMLGGGLALRFAVFRAGFQSARDPRYTVVPQKERLRARESG
ncbi:MAG TPA: NrfD/PsrC family molybdoenzyme membrane anchor subunit [Gaiellaceae bacterium]|nr:NrfD/PsrC family molybdoenzyme membrane anchor subunit [Gaiellaceae bacterium]